MVHDQGADADNGVDQGVDGVSCHLLVPGSPILMQILVSASDGIEIGDRFVLSIGADEYCDGHGDRKTSAGAGISEKWRAEGFANWCA